MAFDSKRLRMFKWLDSLASGKVSDICVYCGSLYATDGIILAKVDYPEFEHLSDWEWSRVSRYVDDGGLLLETPELELRKQFKNDRFFDDMFVSRNEATRVSYNPKVIRNTLKPFEIYRLFPNVATSRNCIQFSAHDKDVSIRVLAMGCR